MMTGIPIVQDEAKRIAALRELEILDTAPEEEFDNIVALACQISETPMGVMGLLDETRFWYKAKQKFPIIEDSSIEFFSYFDTELDTPIVVNDTRLDPRFVNHPLITGSPYIRFSVFIPLTNGDGLLMGYLVVIDTKPKTLSEVQLEALGMLGKQVMSLFKLRKELLKSKRLENESRIDLMDRKQVAKELDKQKSFYENILNKIPTDIAVFGADHRYLFVNPFAIQNEALRKYIIGKDDFEYARYRQRDESIAQKRREQFLEIKAKGKEIRWEDSIVNPAGQTITHLRRLFPVFDDQGCLAQVIGFGIDITERKQLEEKQSVLVKQLSAQNTQLLDFCNIVSHNLRGPLINMSMLVEFIEETNDLDEIKLLVSKLNPVIESLNTTFNELVESIQVRQNLEIETEDIVMKDSLQRALDGLEMEVAKSKAEVSIDMDEAPVVNFPPKYLSSIFHNLISNALKYRSPDRQLTIEVKAKRNGDSILLMVKDNGMGLDLEKHKDNVFKIGKVFHKHPNAKGLGLYMTKAQIEAMDGKIWIESSPDQGAAFFIVFTNQTRKE
jgi:signal transduction histidine kinase